MSSENLNNTSRNDEVDLIRLFNYFKNGIKSIFRRIGKLFDYLLYFIFLLRKNWILVVALMLLGAVYGYVKPLLKQKETQVYALKLKGNSISNMELYSFVDEINKYKDSDKKFSNAELAEKLNIEHISIHPIERDEDIINNYFEQIESNTFRDNATDTLFYHDFSIKNHKSKMLDSDYSLQTLKIKVRSSQTPINEIQEQIITYLKNSQRVISSQEVRFNLLSEQEKLLKNMISNIDSIMAARVIANKNTTTDGNQTMVNTAYRNNVERDLLEAYDTYTKKLFGVRKLKVSYEDGISVISNIHLSEEDKVINNPLIRYSILGFILASLIVLALQFNKYLNKRYENY